MIGGRQSTYFHKVIIILRIKLNREKKIARAFRMVGISRLWNEWRHERLVGNTLKWLRWNYVRNCRQSWNETITTASGVTGQNLNLIRILWYLHLAIPFFKLNINLLLCISRPSRKYITAKTEPFRKARSREAPDHEVRKFAASALLSPLRNNINSYYTPS